MNKTLGAIIIVISTTILSYIPVHEKIKRKELVDELLTVFKIIERELHTNMLSLPEIIELISTKKYRLTSELFININSDITEQGVAYFEKSWRNHMVKLKPHLNNYEFNQLNMFGSVLGQYVLEDQIRYIQECIFAFNGAHENTVNSIKENARLYISLGVSCGLVIIILLL